ncbi:MAG TPA: transcriptional regulator [Anaerolineae bacterium]|nr:transcriptional regulator [Anaerolineae bacterium]
MTDGEFCLETDHDEDGIAQAAAGLMDRPTAEGMAGLFRALSDPTRVRVLSALSRAELCVGELAACLGMSVSAISHQLRLLREMRLVRRRREGKHVFYALDDEHVDGLFRQALEHINEQMKTDGIDDG